MYKTDHWQNWIFQLSISRINGWARSSDENASRRTVPYSLAYDRTVHTNILLKSVNFFIISMSRFLAYFSCTSRTFAVYHEFVRGPEHTVVLKCLVPLADGHLQITFRELLLACKREHSLQLTQPGSRSDKPTKCETALLFDFWFGLKPLSRRAWEETENV